MKIAVNRVLSRMGYIVSRVETSTRLQHEMACLQKEIDRTQQEARAALGAAQHQIETTNVALAAARHETDIARAMAADHGKTRNHLLTELGALQREKLVPPARGSDPRKGLLAIITTSSQVNQLEHLFEQSPLLSRYRTVVVSFIGSASVGLGALCRRNGVVLLNHRLEPAEGGDGVFPRYRWWESYASEPALSYDNHYPFWVALAIDEGIDPEKLGREVRYYNEVRNGAMRALSALAIDLLLIFEDNAEADTGIWVDAANVLGISSCIIPFTIADATEPAEAHLPDPLFHVKTSRYNALAASRYPHWTMTHKGCALVRRPGIAVLAAEWLGVASPSPWILNATRASAIAVESEAMLAHYRRLGLPAAKLVKTGSLSDDVLARAQADAGARTALGIAGNEKVILCAFPPNHLTAVRQNVEFASYPELVAFWMQTLLARPGWRVIVRPHPLAEEDVAALRDSGATVSLAHTASLIPLCDLYVASVSSTIRWAVAAGKPVVNYDVFGYGYTDFDDVAGVIKVTSKDAFAAALARLTSDLAELAHTTALARASAPYWGELDGKSSEQILRLFDLLALERPPATLAAE